MSTRVYVGNIPFSTTEQHLRDHFASVGQLVKVILVTDRETNAPRGFCFVEFADSPSADKAVAELHESMLGGRTLTVSIARERDRQVQRRDSVSTGDRRSANDRSGGIGRRSSHRHDGDY